MFGDVFWRGHGYGQDGMPAESGDFWCEYSFTMKMRKRPCQEYASGCVSLVVWLALFGTASSNAVDARTGTWMAHSQENASLVLL